MNDLANQVEQRRIQAGIVPAPSPSKLFAGGDFKGEPEAFEEFDRRAIASECFTIMREVTGTILNPRVSAVSKSVRIDRILLPTARLLRAGWIHGPIGIEGKKPGHDEVGKVIAQAEDYGRTAFDLGTAQSCSAAGKLPMYGHHVILEWIFLWPFEHQFGAPASIMMQNRIGTVSCGTSNRFLLLFRADQTHAIAIESNGNLTVKELRMGKKAGNRG